MSELSEQERVRREKLDGSIVILIQKGMRLHIVYFQLLS